MVRKSDVPIKDLPEGGPNMLRDSILDIIWQQVSLFEKIQSGFYGNKYVKFKVKN